MHSENCLFLGGFQSSELLVSTAESAVFTLVEGQAADCGEGATAPAFHSSSLRDGEKTHFFCVLNFGTRRRARQPTSLNKIVDRFVNE
jgi:hypothetical protein